LNQTDSQSSFMVQTCKEPLPTLPNLLWVCSNARSSTAPLCALLKNAMEYLACLKWVTLCQRLEHMWTNFILIKCVNVNRTVSTTECKCPGAATLSIDPTRGGNRSVVCARDFLHQFSCVQVPKNDQTIVSWIEQ